MARAPRRRSPTTTKASERRLSRVDRARALVEMRMSTVSPRRQALGIAALLVGLGVLGTAVLALQFDGRIADDAPRRPEPARSPK